MQDDPISFARADDFIDGIIVRGTRKDAERYLLAQFPRHYKSAATTVFCKYVARDPQTRQVTTNCCNKRYGVAVVTVEQIKFQLAKHPAGRLLVWVEDGSFCQKVLQESDLRAQDVYQSFRGRGQHDPDKDSGCEAMLQAGRSYTFFSQQQQQFIEVLVQSENARQNRSLCYDLFVKTFPESPITIAQFKRKFADHYRQLCARQQAATSQVMRRGVLGCQVSSAAAAQRPPPRAAAQKAVQDEQQGLAMQASFEPPQQTAKKVSKRAAQKAAPSKPQATAQHDAEKTVHQPNDDDIRNVLNAMALEAGLAQYQGATFECYF